MRIPLKSIEEILKPGGLLEQYCVMYKSNKIVQSVCKDYNYEKGYNDYQPEIEKIILSYCDAYEKSYILNSVMSFETFVQIIIRIKNYPVLIQELIKAFKQFELEHL